MKRYFYSVFLAAIVVGAAILFPYKTDQQSILSVSAEFGGVFLSIEYATTSAARELGLSGRESMAQDRGILFVFPKDEYYGFWMKDMLFPIDIFWLDAQGHVVSIEQNVATSTYPDVFYPSTPARYVLETVAGFARKHTIVVGTPLVLKNFPSVTE